MKKNKKTVVVVRLNSSEEIFGMGCQVGKVFKIDNPLVMETQDSNEGETFVFMTRWNKYSDETTVSIPMDMVLYVHPLSELMTEYYEKSLVFVEKELKPRFIKGIETAIAQMDGVSNETSEVISFDTTELSEERLKEIRGRLFLTQLSTVSKSNH